MAYKRYRDEVKSKSFCVICGENNPLFLQFDHIDPKTKDKKNFKNPSIKRLKEEYKKCRILCVWCHRIHTQEQLDKKKKDYEKSMLYTDEENLMYLDELARVCKGVLCNGKKRNSSFFYINKITGKARGNCKKCLFFYSKQKRTKNQNFVNNIKLKIGKCEFCKIIVKKEYLKCFDFDHLKPETKNYTIADLITKNSNTIKKIEEEVKKCRLLCCKCHLLRSSKQLGYSHSNHLEYKKEEK